MENLEGDWRGFGKRRAHAGKRELDAVKFPLSILCAELLWTRLIHSVGVKQIIVIFLRVDYS